MCNNSIPANAHNGVVAGENAKSVYVVYSTIVEQETTDIWGVYERSINNPDYDMPKLNEKECSNVNCEFQDLADDLPF